MLQVPPRFAFLFHFAEKVKHAISQRSIQSSDLFKAPFHFTPWHTGSIENHLDFPEKHPAALQCVKTTSTLIFRFCYPPLYVAM